MQRILVTGATGNVGRVVVAQLLDLGRPVRALVRNPKPAKLPVEVEVVCGDLTAPETLDEALEVSSAPSWFGLRHLRRSIQR